MERKGYFVGSPFEGAGKKQEMTTILDTAPVDLQHHQAETVLANLYQEVAKGGHCNEALLSQTLEVVIPSDASEGVIAMRP